MRHFFNGAIAVLLCCTATEASDTMSWLTSARDSVAKLFTGSASYDAIEPGGRRKSVSSRIVSEDVVLNANKRRQLSANAMDLQRNVALAAWAIRQHLNYVALFDFYASSPDNGFNADLQALMERDGKADQADIGGRHPWSRLRRLAEVRKTLDGDCGIMKLRSGHLQGIEGNQFVDPAKKYPNSRWKQGVLLGTGNRALAYNVRETVDGKPRDRMVSAENCFLFGSFEGRFDQVRGISAFATGMNGFRDVDESFDYARAKLKVEQLFALAITRKAEESVSSGSGNLGKRVDGADDSEGDEDEVDETTIPQMDFGKGPVILDLPAGKDAKFLVSGNPSIATQDFLRLCIHVSLLSLDIPMNFFDPKYVNYSGGRTSWNQYERSCISKREDQLSMHEWYSKFRVARFMLPKSAGGTGELILPRSMSVSDVLWEWVPRGVPWWKPSEELDAELRSVAAGLDTPQKICRRHGMGDFFRNLDEIAVAIDAAKKRGIELKFGGMPAPFQLVTPGSEEA